jgi:nucleotide-binding universal stress UspA family protein
MIIITSYKGRVVTIPRKREKLSVKMELLLGSIASGVVTYATCPVMVVK